MKIKEFKMGDLVSLNRDIDIFSDDHEYLTIFVPAGSIGIVTRFNDRNDRMIVNFLATTAMLYERILGENVAVDVDLISR